MELVVVEERRIYGSGRLVLVAWSFRCGAFHPRLLIIIMSDLKSTVNRIQLVSTVSDARRNTVIWGWIERQGRQAWLKDTKHIEIFFFLHHRSCHSYPDSAEKLSFYI